MQQKITSTFTTLLLTLVLMLCAPVAWSQGKLALVIDDIGYNKHDIDAIKLTGQLTYSILPHTPFALEYAQAARNADKEVMLHIPMEAMSGKALGPGGILASMTRVEVETRLAAALDQIPYAVGINNHMGSLLTQQDHSMRWTMEFLYQHGLFFLDSMTSNNSVAESQAIRMGVPAFHRNVFIDNQLTEEYMQGQFDLLVRIAQKYKRAIGIAHPHPETVAFLNKVLPSLKAKGIELVPMSSLLPPKLRIALQQKAQIAQFE